TVLSPPAATLRSSTTPPSASPRRRRPAPQSAARFHRPEAKKRPQRPAPDLRIILFARPAAVLRCVAARASCEQSSHTQRTRLPHSAFRIPQSALTPSRPLLLPHNSHHVLE